MTIALICAMPMEIKPMVKKLGLTKTKVGKLAIYRGEIDGQPVVSIHTGMGPELADRSTEALFAAIPDITRVIVFGITGAVDDDTKIGALVVPEFVVNSLTAEEYKPDPGGLEARGIMWTTNVITLVVMLVSSIGVLKTLLDKRAIRCACLGTALKLPMTKVTLVEDLGMAAMAAGMLVMLATGSG